MNAPVRSYNIELENGQVYKFRLNIKALRKLEETAGKTYQEIVSSFGADGADMIQTMVDFIWAGRIPFDSAVTKEDAENIFDELVDNGFDTTDLQKLIMKILQVSGLMPKDYNVDKAIDNAVMGAEVEMDKVEGSETDPK